MYLNGMIIKYFFLPYTTSFSLSKSKELVYNISTIKKINTQYKMPFYSFYKLWKVNKFFLKVI